MWHFHVRIKRLLAGGTQGRWKVDYYSLAYELQQAIEKIDSSVDLQNKSTNVIKTVTKKSEGKVIFAQMLSISHLPIQTEPIFQFQLTPATYTIHENAVTAYVL